MGERSGAPSGFSPASIVISKPPVAVQLPQPDVSANRDAPHEETNAAISALAREGMSIKQIVRRIGHSRKLVRQVLRGERTDVFPSRQSTIDAYLPFLDAQWTSGCRKGAELWRRLKEQGFRGSLRVVSEWATRRRRAQGGKRSTATQGSPSANDCAAHDRQARSHEQGRYRHCRRHPGGRPIARRGSCAHPAIPRHDQEEGSWSTRSVDR